VGSRFVAVAWRARLARAAAVATAVIVPAACGASDAEVFGGREGPTVSPAATPPPVTGDDPGAGAGPRAVGEPALTSPASAPAAPGGPDAAVADASPPPPAPPAAAGRFPAGGELVVDLTFAPRGEGRIDNPYVAVWIEDAAGRLVRTVSVWYEQSSRGARWLDELRTWWRASGGEIPPAASGATRPAGTASVVWDGTDTDGQPVPHGEYVVFVEAAREDGPYEITSAPLAIGDQPVSVSLDDAGELRDVSAALLVHGAI
jgi:hypothetical protein